MEAQKESLIALSAEIRENTTLLAKTINEYHDQITSIANARNLSLKDVMAVLCVPLAPRFKKKRGPSAFNLYTADVARGNGDLVAAAAGWKELSEDEKKAYDPSVLVYESPWKKRQYQASSKQMIEIFENFRSLVSYDLIYLKIHLPNIY